MVGREKGDFLDRVGATFFKIRVLSLSILL